MKLFSQPSWNRLRPLVIGIGLASLLIGCAAPTAAPPRSTRLLVISDIDDTIKDTHVTRSPDTHAKNPFLIFDPLRNWKAVPGMAPLYRQWKEHDEASFVYVSGGPKVYQSRLQRFLREKNFPQGPIYLKPSCLSVTDHKIATISRLLLETPSAKVVLVGDSGEHDPAIYAKLDQFFPGRVRHIYIHRVTRDADCMVREAIGSGAPLKPKWQVFCTATELPGSTRTAGAR